MSESVSVNEEMAALGATVLETRPAPRPLQRPRPEARPVSFDPQGDAAREAARKDLAEVVAARQKFTAEMQQLRGKYAQTGPHGSTAEVGVHDLYVEHVDTHDSVPDPERNYWPTAARIKARLDVSFHEPARLAVASKRRRARLDGLRDDYEGLKREILDSDEAKALRQLQAKIESLKTAWTAAQAKSAQAHAAFDEVLLAGGDHRAADAALNEAEREQDRLGRQIRLRLGPQSTSDGPNIGPESPSYDWAAVPVLKKAEAAYANTAKATLAFWQQCQIAKSAAAEKAAREGLLEAVADRAIDLEAEQATQQLLNSHLYAQPEPPEIG
jgi:hypothetical protein